MTQDKLRKIITASVAAATLLLVFLLCFLVYQWITIAVLNKREKALDEEIARLEQQNSTDQADLEYYQSVFGKEWLAHQNGFVRPEGN